MSGKKLENPETDPNKYKILKHNNEKSMAYLVNGHAQIAIELK